MHPPKKIKNGWRKTVIFQSRDVPLPPHWPSPFVVSSLERLRLLRIWRETQWSHLSETLGPSHTLWTRDRVKRAHVKAPIFKETFHIWQKGQRLYIYICGCSVLWPPSRKKGRNVFHVYRLYDIYSIVLGDNGSWLSSTKQTSATGCTSTRHRSQCPTCLSNQKSNSSHVRFVIGGQREWLDKMARPMSAALVLARVLANLGLKMEAKTAESVTSVQRNIAQPICDLRFLLSLRGGF